ncbi:MAG: aldehyde dehydrogenase family protein [Bacteroidetes bacterium]|nr:aldehyde dehydrogenase family protein [Bacteroidota bacterium]
MKNFISINPYSEEILAQFEFISENDLEQEISSINNAYQIWKSKSFSERGELIHNLSKTLKRDADKLAELASREMGKLLHEAKAEILKAVSACEFYANQTEALLQKQLIQTELNSSIEIQFQPMGVVLGVFPWNFPYWQILRSVIPILMSGNTILVKPAPNVPQCSIALQQIFNEAGLGKYVRTIFADDNQVEDIISDDRIKAVTLTGSEKAGSAVAAKAAKNIKKSVLELGGSDPFIVLEDADLDACIPVAINSRFQNNGQSCIAAKRFIVHENIIAEFSERIISEVMKLKMGNPLHQNVNIGPLARFDLLENISKQVDNSVKLGAEIVFQSKQIVNQGYFYPPTLLSNIKSNMPAYSQELFGPVLSLFKFENDAEAIYIANDTRFGLGASIWSKNIIKAKDMADKIESGQVFINRLVRSDVRFPFGGIKHSGFGRELGEFGLKEFCYIKSIIIQN